MDAKLKAARLTQMGKARALAERAMGYWHARGHRDVIVWVESDPRTGLHELRSNLINAAPPVSPLPVRRPMAR